MLRRLIRDELYVDSLWLLADALSLALFGFLFWTIAAAMATPDQVGIASTLVASAELLMTISILGFDTTLIRFAASNGERLINAVLTLSGGFIVLLTFLFLLVVPLIVPRLSFLQDPILGLLFTLFVLSHLVFTLLSGALIGLGEITLLLTKDMFFNLFKVGGVFFLAGLGAFGIFSSWMVASAIAIIVIMVFSRINFKPLVDRGVLKNLWAFSLVNYASNFLALVPQTILPLLITVLLEPSFTAYYYVSWMIASVIFFVPHSVSKKLLSVSDLGRERQEENKRKAILYSFLLLAPILLIVLPFAHLILLVFGPSYSLYATQLLHILIVSSIPFAINTIFIALMNARRNLFAVFSTHLVIIATTLILSVIFIERGIQVIGSAWLFSQGAVSLYTAREVMST